MAADIPTICTSAPGSDRRAFHDGFNEAVETCFVQDAGVSPSLDP